MEKSGLNPQWTKGLSNFTKAIADKFTVDLSKAPVKVCDAEKSCKEPASWLMQYHGCYSYCVCEQHLVDWLKVITQLTESGGMWCERCDNWFHSPGRAVTWRII